MTQAVLMERRASEECRCPEELWLVGGVDCTIHEEGDGTVHVFMDDGDAEAQITLRLPTLDVAREPALGWAKAMLHATSGWR